MTENEINEAIVCHHAPMCVQPKDYCHSIEAAWEIVKKLQGGSLKWCESLWSFHISGERGKNRHTISGSAAAAIRLAFLELP